MGKLKRFFFDTLTGRVAPKPSFEDLDLTTTRTRCQACEAGRRRATKNEIYDSVNVPLVALTDEAYLAGYEAARAFITGKGEVVDMCYTGEAAIDSWNMGVRDALGDLNVEDENEELHYDYRVDGNVEDGLTFKLIRWESRNVG